MSLKANVITIFSPQRTTDQQPQAPNTQSSFINQIIHPSSLFHTTIFILQLLFLPSVSPLDRFRRPLTTPTISFAVSSIFNPRSWNQPHFEAQVELFQDKSLSDQQQRPFTLKTRAREEGPFGQLLALKSAISHHSITSTASVKVTTGMIVSHHDIHLQRRGCSLLLCCEGWWYIRLLLLGRGMAVNYHLILSDLSSDDTCFRDKDGW